MGPAQIKETQLPPSPPPPPRALTPRALRRSLVEPRVRFWWATALVLLAAAVFFLVLYSSKWYEELKIVQHGTSITATVHRVGDSEVNGVGNLPPDYPVVLQFDFNDVQYTVSGYLEGRKESISPKQKVPIKIDPDDPNQWTYLTESPPIWESEAVLSAGLMAPFVAAAALVSWLLRRRVLATWQTGTANLFMVEGTTQTALAPSSRAVRCRPLEGRDHRLVSVFIPRRVADPKVGELLWLIHPPGKPAAALAAIAYEGK